MQNEAGNVQDEAIIDLFWKRSEKAVTMASEKYHGFCFSIAWNILFNREDCEECVNDTWFAAWKYIPPQRPSRLSLFLGKITRGFAIDMLRKKTAAKRIDTHMAQIVSETELFHAALAHSLDAQIAAKDLVIAINCFLEKCKSRERDIFVQRYWAMEPLSAIAKRHQMSEGAVKQSLWRTRRKLQKTLEKEGYL